MGLMISGGILLFLAIHSKQKKILMPLLLSGLVTFGVFIIIYATILIAGLAAL